MNKQMYRNSTNDIMANKRPVVVGPLLWHKEQKQIQLLLFQRSFLQAFDKTFTLFKRKRSKHCTLSYGSISLD